MRYPRQRSRIGLIWAGAIVALCAGDCMASDAKAKYLLEQASARLAVADMSAAERLYAEAVQESPNDVAIAMALAEFYILQRRFDNAEALIATHRQTHAGDFRVWRMQGLAHRMAGEQPQAIASFEKAYTLPGGNEDIVVVGSLLKYYEATGNTARMQQMQNSMQWIEIKNKH